MLADMALEIRYERWFRPISVPFGLGPKQSSIEVDGDTLTVKMGWGFRAAIPLSSVRSAKRYNGAVLGWGVHGGWRGGWLVNGSSKGIVELTIDPPADARVSGIPVRLRTLQVSVTDPDELIAACGANKLGT